MAIAFASLDPAQPPAPVCPPQESISQVAGVDEQSRPNAANVKSNKKNWRAVQAVGVSVARDIDRGVRDTKYKARKTVYGPIDAPYLLGPEPLSLARYLGAPEVRDWIISQKSSHAMKMFEDLLLEGDLDGPNGDGAHAVLIKVVKRYAAEQPEGIRYWQRVKNVIWKPFVGLLNAREQNLKARHGEEEKLARRNHRAEKEKLRLGRRHNPAAARQRQEAKANRLRTHAAKLRSLAENKETKARTWLAQAQALSAAAAEKENKAARIERQLPEPRVPQKPEERA